MRTGILLIGLLIILASCTSEVLEVSDVATYESRAINYSDASSVVAVVNGEELTVADVRSSAIRFGVAPSDEVFDELLEGLIIARLVSQGEVVDEADLESRIDDIAGNLSRAELETVLAAQGLSIDLVRERIREELVLTERFSENVAEPSQDRIRAYYANNTMRFITPERIVFQHFFVQNDSRTAEEQQRLLQGYLEENASSRCDYIARYSDDTTSSGERCGLLTISRGTLIPELEYGVYGTPRGSSRAVASRFGTHIVTVEEIVPLQALNLTEAEPFVREILLAEDREKAARQEISGLLRDANIVVYYSR